jgi:hypothetical protein
MSVENHLFYKKSLFLTFLVTVFCFLFTYLYYGFYYVEYEALFDSFYSGKLTEGLPFRSIYFLGNIGTSYLYSLLYQFNSHIEWISWILYSYLFISCFMGLYLIVCMLPRSVPLWVKIGLQVAVYLLVFADHNIHFIFTRVSYMVTGLSLIALVYFFRLPGSIKERWALFIGLNLWFIVGTLTRSESATAAFLQIGAFALFYLHNIKRSIILFLFPFLFLLSLLAAIAHDIKTTKEFYKQIEPDIEAQFTDRENVAPLSTMKTYRDSVIWSAARDIMWSDPKVITPAYLRSLIIPEKFIYTDWRQWQRVYRSASEIVLKFWCLGLICLLLGLAVLISGRVTSPAGFLYWLLFVLSFWILIALQTYTDKINDRSFSPLISLFIYCHIILLLPYIKPGVSRLMYPILAGVIILFGIHLYYLKAEASQLKRDLADYQKNMRVISQIASGKILVVNSSSCDYLFCSNRPFHPFDFSAFKKIYITDGYNMPFLPYYRRYLERECHCDMYEFPVFWDYLRMKHNEVIVVSTIYRMNILQQYLKAVHNYNLPITEDTDTQLLKLEKSDYRGAFANLKIYTLEK